MLTRHAEATWNGDLPSGKGAISTQSTVLSNQPYSFKTRFENEKGAGGTNPEELIAAAHAACFSMALSHLLATTGHKPTEVKTTAEVTLDKVADGFKITKILLTTTAIVPGLDNAAFQETAHKAKTGCPISQALSATPIELKATLAT